MSDDKREKLREYLRNNRPRNKTNSGNNSNNKENSNKNLENDLNSDNLNLNNNSDLDNSQILNNKINSNKRDYDKEPLIIRDYSSFFTGTQYIFVVMFGAMMFSLFFGYPVVIVLFFIIIIPNFILEYYFSIKKFECGIKFKNSEISFIVDDETSRNIDIKEISRYICKPFWKTSGEFVNLYAFILFFGIFLIFSIYIPLKIIFLLIVGLIGGFLLFEIGNIIHKMIIYFFINKTLYGFRFFPILIIAEPIKEKETQNELIPVYRYGADFKCYYIYFYNNAVYEKVREYFLQNLSIDIEQIKNQFAIM
ncbi:hypothetical protein CYJ41_02410 [Campylobacter ureolyticus]|uniref:Uncharacterized protein n=1 Tax=Campylobacter ureolyticus TaxID=827 RepID=A0A2I1NBJ4_9BACT|nr:hypothetical protein [Campylobacter ureolyticus]MCR8699973.1 hypothetical protein [Campylobacter ureolyticus]MDU7070426.1 hypothetical protein [Campylobacter ureolyticus]PKZ29763.1 hypothetical protein CYJ41_02410 [Campylobacter ureolyticus]